MMFLQLDKIKETKHKVFYKVSTIVKGKPYISKSKNIRYKTEKKIGEIEFEKESNEIRYNMEKTDSYFQNRNLELEMIKKELIKHKKNNFFPMIMDIVSG